MVYLSRRQVQKALRNDDYLGYTNMKRAPNLSPVHRIARLPWARSQLHQNPRSWGRTVFSDKKRFYLDGADSTAYCCAGSRTTNMRRRIDGLGVFCARAKAHLVLVDGNIDAVKYKTMLADVLLRFSRKRTTKGADFNKSTLLRMERSAQNSCSSLRG